MRRAIYAVLAAAVLTAAVASQPRPSAAVHQQRHHPVVVRAHDALMAAAARKKPPALTMPGAQGVSYVNGPYPGYENDATLTAAYDSGNNTVYWQGELDPFTKGHENGHAIAQLLSDGDKSYFTKLMGRSGPWSQGTGITNAGKRSPDELFADWYGNAAIGNDPSRSWDSAYSTPPDPKTFRRFEQAMARFGRRHGLQAYVR